MKRMFVTDPKKREHTSHRRPHREAPGAVWKQKSELWAKAFTVVSMGRIRQGRVSKFRIG